VGSPGCSVQGFVLVKKVPGNMHISAHSHKHSFDFSVMNMTHQVKSPTTCAIVYIRPSPGAPLFSRAEVSCLTRTVILY